MVVESDPIMYYNYDLNNSKDFAKLIRKIESVIRKSAEYDVWQIRTKIGTYCCPICKQDPNIVNLESHHHPVTLYDIVANYIEQLINDNNLTVRPLIIADEIMQAHLRNEIEHVIICKHCHEKFHNGDNPTVIQTEYIYQQKYGIGIDDDKA